MNKDHLKQGTFRLLGFKEAHLESEDLSLSPGSFSINCMTMTSYQGSLGFHFLIYEMKRLARSSLIFHPAVCENSVKLLFLARLLLSLTTLIIKWSSLFLLNTFSHEGQLPPLLVNTLQYVNLQMKVSLGTFLLPSLTLSSAFWCPFTLRYFQIF